MAQEYTAEIVLGARNRAQGVRLLGPQVPGPEDKPLDVATTPAREGGRDCRRFRHRRFAMVNGGWARGKSRRVDVSAAGMCFALPGAPARPLYVTVDYLDRGMGPFTLTRGGEEAYGLLLDTGQWQTLTVRLEPGEASYDLALLCNQPMWVSRVRVDSRRPAGYQDPERARFARAQRALGGRPVGIAAPVGNIGSISAAHDLPELRAITAWLPIYRALGVTSVQSYVRWASVEPQPGKLDWSYYDRAVELLARWGMKWVAFVMIGPSYATPQWFRESERSVYVRCLEHGRDCPVQSIWNPHLLPEVDRFFGLLAERYGGTGMVESLMLGPSGDFGETTYNAVFGNFGGPDYHTHVGYWCGDDHARADFPRHLERQYGSLDALNRAWGTHYARWDQVAPFTPPQAPSRRAEIDFTDWYIGCMTRWSERWAEIAHRHFPQVPIYHAAGGSGDPIHGGDWPEQVKVSAPHGTGMRITNEGTPYAFNFVYARWAATACKFYGAPFGNEPWGGDMSALGNVSRLYNAVTSGADQFWTYAGHLQTPDCIEAFRRFRHHLQPTVSQVEVAVYYPKLHFALTDERAFAETKPRSLFWPQAEELRDLTDFDLLDATLIADGALAGYRYLVLLQGSTMRRAEMAAIEAWVAAGGLLITHDFGPVQDEEGNEWEWLAAARLSPLSLGERVGVRGLGSLSRRGKGAVACYPGCANRRGRGGDHHDKPATRRAFLRLVAGLLRQPERLGLGLPPRLEPDGVMDGVYATRVADGVLYLNTNAHPVTKRLGRRRVTVPGYSIHKVKIRQAYGRIGE